MNISMNLTTCDEDLERFSNQNDLKNFYKGKGLDGIELMVVGKQKLPEIISKENVNGIHLSYYSSWVDFWNGDIDALNEEFGDKEVWQQYYGGCDKSAIINKYRAELDFAQSINAKYVVFHIAECRLNEAITCKYKSSDKEVCSLAIELINTLLDGQDYSFYFLMENLWHSGLTFTDPKIAKYLLDGVHYDKKGFMLDTGHLLHTNNALRNEEDAVKYIHHILDKNSEIIEHIHGIHLQQSLTGEYVEEMLKGNSKIEGKYYDKLMEVYSHIFNIDLHNAFTTPSIKSVVDRVNPLFLTHEFISSSREELSQKLDCQTKLFR